MIKEDIQRLVSPVLLALIVAGAVALRAETAVNNAVAGRETLALDAGWRFHLGDIPFPVIKGHGETYNNAKAGRASGAAAADYDDTDWRQVDLPHDWVVEGPFDSDANVSQGYRPRGFAWYRRHFKLDPADRGKHLELQFDGVATHCTVWVNGTVAHRNWCGYTSFYIDITPLARYGDEVNTIAVRVDANAQEGWWYEGGGIYRHTWLVKRSPVHLATDGVFAQPVKNPDGSWTLPVEATLENAGKAQAGVEVESTVIAPDGKEVAEGGAWVAVNVLDRAVARFVIPVRQPYLWSVDEPTLYSVRTVVRHDGVAIDSVTTQCGFRTIRFDADKGFFLNDEPLKLKGVCNHQDAAGVGVAVPDSLWAFRLRKLKEMGANAYRCAHHPPAKEFLDACDRAGILVMDENRHFNSTPEYIRQLEWMVRRDCNHPSVILWSVFNEEPMQGTEIGYEMVRRMVAAVKRLDTTRPVTAAMNGGQFTPVNVSQAVDVVGFNYCTGGYDGFHQEHPGLPMTSSEDTSAVMQRGEFTTDKTKNILGSYDTEHPGWGATHRAAWKAIATRSFIAGGFVWTGFDYRGEPTPFTWPTAGANFGCMDLCGFPKTAFFIHQAQWVTDRPVLQIVPHWNWPGREGQPVRVMAMCNAETVALFFNGKLIGEQKVDPFEMNFWDVPYAPGKLEAVAKKGGKEVARSVADTTGEPVALKLVPDRGLLAGDGADAQPVTVCAVDAQGRQVPTSNLPVEFEIAGPGSIIGLGNGDPNSHEAEEGGRRNLFKGLAQVIVQSKVASGTITLRAKSAGVQPAELSIPVSPAKPVASVNVAQPRVMLDKWRMAPATMARPDPNREISDSDQNTWVNVQAGKLPKLAGGNWTIFRATFKPHAAQRTKGGQICFRGITGKAEVWLDKKLVAQKSVAASAPLIVPLAPGEGNRTVSVLIEGETEKPAGLSGGVSVEPFE